MRLHAALGKARDGGGWPVAFWLALGAAALSAVVLAVVAFGAFDEPPPPAAADVPASPVTATTTPTLARPTAAVATRTPRPSATVTVAPVQPFGRSVTLIEDPALGKAIEEAVGEREDDFSVVVVRSSDGRSAFVDPDRVFYAASLFKLAILYEAGLRLSRAELDLGDRLFLTDEDLAQDLGTLQYLQLDEEKSLTVGAALEAMVTLSDNATAVALLHAFTGAEIDLTLRGLGIDTMSVNTTELPTTARDMARLMDAILSGEGLDPATHELLLGILARQRTASGIPSGLPAGVTVGNKTGTWEAITHDVAYVVAEGGPYVIAVLTNTQRDWEGIAAVSAAVFDAMERP